jgi:broad specificity phosphatase PhoE
MAVRASTVEDPGAIDRFFSQEQEGRLSDRGRRQAERVADRLRTERLAAVYSSPLIRARETAEVTAAALGLELRVTDRITELKTGRLREGSPESRWIRGLAGARLPWRIKRPLLGSVLIPTYFYAWRSGRTVGGETPDELEGRIGALLAELEGRFGDGDAVALFAHGYLLVTLTHALGPAGWAALARRPYIPNGSICEMELRGGALRLVRHADARHLDGLAR